ncbi:tyrosine-type recombinase/integrase [Sulfurimonas sp.]|uniref:tyrosine-type recombinase/integrase n=1 Tax=Sulfurimonas sp. TaxID=2022749 RepID=UPI00356463AC
MALNDSLKKINIPVLDTKGLYLKDSSNLFSKKELNKNDLKKLDYENISIVLKFYFRNKQIKKTISFNSITGLQAIKKAISKRTELKEELEEHGLIKKKDFKTLNEYWDEYVTYKASIWDPNTKITNTTFYDKWIRDKAGEINFEKVTTRDLQDIVNLILKSTNPLTKKIYSPRTALSVKQQIRSLYNYYMKQNVIDKNPATNIEIPKFDNTVNFELSDEERLKLFEAIKSYPIQKYKGVMLFIYAGRRLNEVLTLDWRNINFNSKTYNIEGIYAKNRRNQEFPLNPLLEKFLLSYDQKSSGLIFTAHKDRTKPLSQETFRRHWKKLIDSLGINMRIHDSRHLLGNTMINKGYSLEAIGKTMGHSSVHVTKRYAKTDLNTANDVLSDYLN